MDSFYQAVSFCLILFSPLTIWAVLYVIGKLTRGCKEGKHKFVAYLVLYNSPTNVPEIHGRGIDFVEIVQSFAAKRFEVRCEKCGIKPEDK